MPTTLLHMYKIKGLDCLFFYLSDLMIVYYVTLLHVREIFTTDQVCVCDPIKICIDFFGKRIVYQKDEIVLKAKAKND